MPRTLAQNAQYINETIKPAIKSAIEAQGVTVPSTDSFLDYADRIAEIEGGGSGYQLKDLPTGSISAVNDAAPLPLNALKVSVEAWQEGSGDPSPSNIRPIHGFGSGEIDVVGKNWVKYDNANNSDRGRYFYSEESAERTVCTKKIDGGLFVLQYLIHLRKGETYCFSFDSYTYDSISQTYASIYIYSNILWGSLITFFDITKTGITWTSSYTGTAVLGIFVTQPANTEIVFEKLMISKGTTATTYEPYQGKQYTQQFPQTIYGAEWDVVDGVLKQTDGYIASYNGETLPSTWISDRDVYASGTTPTIGAEVVYKLATPTTIDLSPLSIRMLEGTNNLYADCGEVIEGEYFVDEGAIDVRKVDYQIGSSGSIKTTDGRVLSGFASMSGYHARPLDASGNWLDVDWSKDFEIGVAFKTSSFPISGNATIFGSGVSGSMNYAPNLYFWQGSTAYITLSENGSSSAVDTALNYTFQTDTWYFVRVKFTKSTLNLKIEVSTDMSNFTTAYNDTLAAAPYHDAASISIGGMAQNVNYSSNDMLIDTFNTYIKGDGVNWGASTEAFPS